MPAHRRPPSAARRPDARVLATSLGSVGIPAKTRDHGRVRRLAAVLGSILAGAVIGLGCSHAGVFECESSEQCQDGTRAGVCTEAGYCAFEDESCESDLAYGALAVPELAGKCVPVGGGTESGTSSGPGSSDEPSSSSSSSSSEGPAITGDETGPTTGCAGGMGTPCEPADPCALGGTCDASGSCVPTGVITCNAPPAPCFSPEGQCQPDGSCAYPPAPPMSECEDGDLCTVGDLCDGMGTCTPGALCPNAGECQFAACVADGCVYSQAVDGSSCGAALAERCCGGECVDISSDPSNCGGCGSACVDGQECESVELTVDCQDAPPATSGRCRCGMADDQCPLGQLCRTEPPYAGRCAPSDAMACDGVLVEVQLCPNYCGY